MNDVPNKKLVLFLCTGNSCRSQMAEAITNHEMWDGWMAYSAGTKPAGYVHPRALEVLAEIGIQHEGYSKTVDEFIETPFNLVVTVCDSAAEKCPVWLAAGRRIHKSYQDPAAATGTEQEIMNAFRVVRDDILREIPDLLRESWI